jgi:hypothetical protein
MPPSPVPDIEVKRLHQYLKDTLRRGARAARLIQHVPGIIDLLYPPDQYPHLSRHQRALCVEEDIRRAIDEDIGGAAGEAVATILCLRPGTLGRTLEDRRRVGATYLDLEPGTFRRDRHEGALLLDLAVEILKPRLNQR